MLLNLDVKALAAEMNAALDDQTSLESTRELLLRFASTHAIPV
jgi:phosphotransferase system enzyme I (PtsP)